MSENINQNITPRGRKILSPDFETLRDGIKKNDLLAVSQAITLVENKNLEDSQELLKFLSKLQADHRTLRIAISGPPGVGKSTFIESLGMELIKSGRKVAVLAVDPSSERTRGSILADKTRMSKLTSQQNAFIRPSANATEIGGVRSSTYDSIKICEAAGFDIILVETVGVGQSEIEASKITDLLILLLAPAGGDELQGIKKGIVEVADFILVNKADQGLEKLAKLALKEYHAAIHMESKNNRLLDPIYFSAISAFEHKGIDQIATKIEELMSDDQFYVKINEIRTLQDRKWFQIKAKQLITRAILANEEVQMELSKLEQFSDIYQALSHFKEYLGKVIK